MPHIRNVDS